MAKPRNNASVDVHSNSHGDGGRRNQSTAQQHANHESRGEQEHVQQGDVLGAQIVGDVDGHVGQHDRQRLRAFRVAEHKPRPAASSTTI